jgi:hypothetical protein
MIDFWGYVWGGIAIIMERTCVLTSGKLSLNLRCCKFQA